MKRRFGTKLFFLGLCLVVAAAGASAQEREVVSEFDPGFGLALDLTRKVRFDFFTGKEKSEELHSRKSKVSVGLSFRVKPLFKSFLDDLDTDKHHVLVVGVGYEYSRASENDTSTTTEKKIMIDAIGRWVFPKKLLMTDRNRFEFRWIDGDYHFRYRNRLMLERPFKVSKFRFTPYGATEVFWDQRYDKWNRTEFTGGVQIPFVKRTWFDVYYSRVHCVTCADPHTNIVGMAFNVFLRLKKK